MRAQHTPGPWVENGEYVAHAPCEMEAICLGCTPRNADGSCPDAPKVAHIEPIAFCDLNLSGKGVAFFDGKPMLSAVRNGCHPHALYLGPAPGQEPAAYFLQNEPGIYSQVSPEFKNDADVFPLFRAAPQNSRQEPAAPFDVENMIATCLPGGYACDPQRVADEIREYCKAIPQAAAPIPSHEAASQGKKS